MHQQLAHIAVAALADPQQVLLVGYGVTRSMSRREIAGTLTDGEFLQWLEKRTRLP